MKSILFLFCSVVALNALAADPPGHPERHGQLRTIAGKYLKAQLVNPAPLVAPTRCMVPPTPVLHSDAKSGKDHGGKLFYLFAKARKPLAAKQKHEAQPVGQYLVKETWAVQPYDATKSQAIPRHASGQWVSKHAMKDGKEVMIGEPLDLYIMLKQAPDTPGTDQGWTYAVLSRDGQTVRKAGRIQSCIDCHEDAKHDRILGDYTEKNWPAKIKLPGKPRSN